jgi:choline dehydrogenase-like flavoprotein
VVTASREVILSAGSVGTAQILQLSGIGNQNDLSALKINTIINNPSVGANLSDHTLLPNLFSVRGTDSFDHVLRDSVQVNAQVTDWVTNKTGMLINNVVNNFGFARLPSNASIFSTESDPAAGPGSPHWEIITSVNQF